MLLPVLPLTLKFSSPPVRELPAPAKVTMLVLPKRSSSLGEPMATVAPPPVNMTVFEASPFNVTVLCAPPTSTVLKPPLFSIVTVLWPAGLLAGSPITTVTVELESFSRSTLLVPPLPCTVKLIVEPSIAS